MKIPPSKSRWLNQPNWNKLVKLGDHFPKKGIFSKNIFELPPPKTYLDLETFDSAPIGDRKKFNSRICPALAKAPPYGMGCKISSTPCLENHKPSLPNGMWINGPNGVNGWNWLDQLNWDNLIENTYRFSSMIFMYTTGQIIIIPKPELRGFWKDSHT